MKSERGYLTKEVGESHSQIKKVKHKKGRKISESGGRI